MDNLGLTPEQRADAGEIVRAIGSYVEGQINESVERRSFRQRSQQPGESFDDLLLSLRELAKTCKFCSDECLQRNIRDQIISGLLDGDAVEILLRESNISLATTVDKCRAQEAARKQRGEMAGTNPLISILRQQDGYRRTTKPARFHDRPPPPSDKPNLPERGTSPNDVSRPGCGFDLHPGGRQSCPAYKQVCNQCKKVGHFARVCRSGRRPVPRGLYPDSRFLHVDTESHSQVSALEVSNCSTV